MFLCKIQLFQTDCVFILSFSLSAVRYLTARGDMMSVWPQLTSLSGFSFYPAAPVRGHQTADSAAISVQEQRLTNKGSQRSLDVEAGRSFYCQGQRSGFINERTNII